jgi:hypothetical protein
MNELPLLRIDLGEVNAAAKSVAAAAGKWAAVADALLSHQTALALAAGVLVGLAIAAILSRRSA